MATPASRLASPAVSQTVLATLVTATPSLYVQMGD